MTRIRDWKLQPLHWAVVISALLHVLAISALGFSKPEPRRGEAPRQTLDVVLVNAHTRAAPLKADALAQANLDGGGNTELERRMASPLPPPDRRPLEAEVKPAAQRQPAAAATATAAPRKPAPAREAPEPTPEVMTRDEPSYAAATAAAPPPAASEPQAAEDVAAPGDIDSTELVAKSLEAVRLQAMIAKNQELYQKRPKRRMFGARTREYRFAAYIEAWRQKVEKVGNLNYPQAARENRLYGQLRMTVAIMADGSVERIEINRSSGQPVLDEAARRIVQLAAPYAVFPPDISRDTDIIEIVRTWTFTREDTLASGD